MERTVSSSDPRQFRSEERLLRLAEVIERVSLGKTSIYKRIEEGTFPRPLNLGPNTVRWRSSDIDTWISSLQPATAT